MVLTFVACGNTRSPGSVISLITGSPAVYRSCYDGREGQSCLELILLLYSPWDVYSVYNRFSNARKLDLAFHVVCASCGIENSTARIRTPLGRRVCKLCMQNFMVPDTKAQQLLRRDPVMLDTLDHIKKRVSGRMVKHYLLSDVKSLMQSEAVIDLVSSDSEID